MKRFVICFDGTWQSLRQGKLTNIGVIARSVGHTTHDREGNPIAQVVIYSRGVGTSINALDRDSFLASLQAWFVKLWGGMFGSGAEDQIVDAYLRLAFNFEHGDEIYIFGFSRGAFAARSLAGMINCAGIISRLHVEKVWEAFRLYRRRLRKNASEQQKAAYAEERRQFRRDFGKGRRDETEHTRIQTDDVPPIAYLGLFDTVVQRGLLGVALNLLFDIQFIPERYKFHNLNISANVVSARHAVAIDERRTGFPLQVWENLEEADAQAGGGKFHQRWFVGTHGDVGGGGSQLAAKPLQWVVEGAASCGLRFYAKYGDDESDLHRILRQAGLEPMDASKLTYDAKITRPDFLSALSPHNWPASPRRIWRREGPPSTADAETHIDEMALMRACANHVRPRYLPRPLRPFRAALREVAARLLPQDKLRGEDKRFLFFF